MGGTESAVVRNGEPSSLAQCNKTIDALGSCMIDKCLTQKIPLSDRISRYK